MKDIKKNMIQIYNLEALGYDFMGYTFKKTNELSFHHLIIPRCKSEQEGIGDGYVQWNGAILNQRTSHEYLHRIEQIDRDTFLRITDLMVIENINKKIDKETLLRIRELLLAFENKHWGEAKNNGHQLIKSTYVTNRIWL